MRMARVNVYLPEELAAEVKAVGMNVSQIAQRALRDELAGGRTNAWLAEVRRFGPTGVTAEEALRAVREAKDELEGKSA